MVAAMLSVSISLVFFKAEHITIFPFNDDDRLCISVRFTLSAGSGKHLLKSIAQSSATDKGIPVLQELGAPRHCSAQSLHLPGAGCALQGTTGNW